MDFREIQAFLKAIPIALSERNPQFTQVEIFTRAKFQLFQPVEGADSRIPGICALCVSVPLFSRHFPSCLSGRQGGPPVKGTGEMHSTGAHRGSGSKTVVRLRMQVPVVCQLRRFPNITGMPGKIVRRSTVNAQERTSVVRSGLRRKPGGLSPVSAGSAPDGTPETRVLPRSCPRPAGLSKFPGECATIPRRVEFAVSVAVK